MISSQPFSLMRKPFFSTTCRSFGSFYGHENHNIIRSFMVVKPWRSNSMLHSKEIPKCGHRLSFFISYSMDRSGSRDFPSFERKGPDANVEVRVSSHYKWIEPARLICFRQMEAGKGDTCVKDGQKVKIHYKCYDIHTNKVRHETNPEHDPEIIGPGENKIREGLYDGIVGMRVEQIRRIVLPPSSDLTGEHNKMMMKKKHFEEHGIYDVCLVEIIG
ncbi:uncharacterized protein LOC133677782 isoform X2 [Populus nigra]|uniref:uncharacterized protein LOC133677782 isoform X2 n=1 Tax=Populus nigra TaxID=3691 RepID=UPI002B27A082|nr:uncharacterized protein LOC133677782 isoform X2 [Populus nigra]